MPAHRGACLCGQTKITIEKPAAEQVVCHCVDCRQTTGSAFSTLVVALEAGVKIEGPTKTFQSPAESGRTVTRIFCSVCGSQIAHNSGFVKAGIIVQTGNFADFAEIPITAELYVKDRWSALSPIEGAAQIDAMPPVAPSLE
ncbi:hypothetical protein BDN72DRAFT_844135 [Pluteus cervinus]|uniref:Uncharacterized protein n=1 Tax=Pluteus cervinus TaxID=181527 RepID=A0ACD3ALV4_9AGAR|nr:hypothetical protein BDN72DRAFT_844135 [Pluteus cervinus]